MDVMFTERTREEDPLKQLLTDCSRVVRESVDTYPQETFQRHDDEALFDLAFANSRLSAGDVVRDGRPVVHPEPAQISRVDDEGREHSYWRWVLTFPVAGGTEMLGYWPRGFEREPLKSDAHHHPATDAMWEVHGDSVIAKFDIEVVDDPEGNFPADRLRAAEEYLDEAMEAMNAERAEFVTALRDRALADLARRRADLDRWGQQIADAIGLELAEQAPVGLVDGVPPADAPTAQVEEGEVALPKVLETRTFRDLVGTTLRWGAAASRYGAAFSQLDEEAITGLLVATLNAVFDTAHREVFDNGKTDIFVESFRGERHNAAYFGEAKKWGGQAKVKGALDQTLGYCNAATADTMLLYYVENQNLSDVIDAARAAIEESGLLERWETDEFENSVATVRHEQLGTLVRVHLVYVHVRRPEASDGEPGENPTRSRVRSS